LEMDAGTFNSGACPHNLLLVVCPIFENWKYSAPLAFADYWKDATDQETYLKSSRFLADLNNEKETKNSTYKKNMMSLKEYVLVMAEGDGMVIPKESEQHGFYKWGNSYEIEKLEDTEGYKGDWLGLQSLDKEKRIVKLSFPGDHLRFSQKFWNEEILPRLGTKFNEDLEVQV